ncbi:MAG: dihydrolipoamide acetyltransferase family protein [Gemmatimonadaceae bacterium]
MARIDVIMPQMGESIAEGTLSRWLKKVGDEVKRDEPLFEISTDKVDAEIPAPSAGIVAEVLVQEGETVAVQTVVARLETEKGAAMGGGGGGEGGSTAKAERTVGAAVNVSAAAGGPPHKQSGTAQPSVRHPSTAMMPAPAHKGDGENAGPGVALEERLRTRSSPLVRKIAAEHGIEIASLQGSGLSGRVTRKDILQFIESGGDINARAAVHASGAGAYPPAGGPLPQPRPGDIVEPMSRMRALISEHMVASRRTSAHVTSFMEVDFTRVARIRAARRAEFLETTGLKLTYMPFIIRAVVDGLKAWPILNASIAGTNVIYRKQFNIGVAVALDWGLIVPVIKGADGLSITGITRNLNDVAARARARKLSPEEVQDGTFTITNPGVFGSLMGTPIINQPQVAILGVGTIEKRPKVIAGADGEDTIAIRTCSYFSISFDHRAIDGAVADQFLAHVKRSIEEFPDTGP